MRTRKILIMAAATLLFIGCKGNNDNNADDPLAASGRTQRTENLLTNLKAQAQSHKQSNPNSHQAQLFC